MKEWDGKVLNFASEKFCFEMADLHCTVASCLITYLSFKCFNDGPQEETSRSIPFKGDSLLNYSTQYLLKHFTQSTPSTDLAEKLALFFQSLHGWQWLQRLETEHGISFGHLQLMQSQLKSWSNALYVDEKYRNVLSGFLLVLAHRRYEDSKVFPAEHEKRLMAMSALANSCRQHGKYDRAEELDVQVMETTKRVLGAEHPDTLTSMANLASTYWNQGRWTEAEELDVQVMETRKRVLGAEHPSTLTSMNNLAHTYKLEDRHDEAIELMRSVVDLLTKRIGVDHPHTLSAADTLNTWSRT